MLLIKEWKKSDNKEKRENSLIGENEYNFSLSYGYKKKYNSLVNFLNTNINKMVVLENGCLNFEIKEIKVYSNKHGYIFNNSENNEAIEIIVNNGSTIDNRDYIYLIEDLKQIKIDRKYKIVVFCPIEYINRGY